MSAARCDVSANSRADEPRARDIHVRALSRRAVVVRVPDGAERGSVVHERHPSEEYLSALASGSGGFVRDEVERPFAQQGGHVGSPSAEAAGRTAPPDAVAVFADTVPAHMARSRTTLRRQAVAR